MDRKKLCSCRIEKLEVLYLSLLLIAPTSSAANSPVHALAMAAYSSAQAVTFYHVINFLHFRSSSSGLCLHAVGPIAVMEGSGRF